MSADAIKLIVGIVQGTLDKGQSVPLHELLWTVDARLHLTISADEINKALRRVTPVRITRTGGRAELVPSAVRTKVEVTAGDVDSAAAIYREQVSGMIDKLIGTRAK